MMSEQNETPSNTRYYRSLLSKPTRLFRATKTAPLPVSEEDEKATRTVRKETTKAQLPPPLSVQSTALREAPKEEVYKLSTINDLGVYLPPSPNLKSKRDHWIDIDQEDLAFRLPSPDRLTTSSGESHNFFTPSAMIHI